MSLSTGRASGFIWLFVVVSMLAACGNRIPYTSEVGSVSVVATSMGEWDEYQAALTPNFKLKSAKEVLSSVIPDTARFETKTLDAFGADVAVDIAGAVDGAGVNSPIEGTRTAAGLPGIAELLGDETLAKDPLLAYELANALYQEVQILDRYIENTVIPNGYRAFVVRLYLRPDVRPYFNDVDVAAYTTLSFFGRQEVTETGTSYAKVPPAPAGSIDGRFLESHVRVLPLLVLDHVEAALQSRSIETLRRVSGSFSGLIGDVGAGADFESLVDSLESSLARESNSLLSVTRASENSLRVRLGGQYTAEGQLVLTRNQPITALVLVPKQYWLADKDGGSGRFKELASRGRFELKASSDVDPTDGDLLSPQIEVVSYSRFQISRDKDWFVDDGLRSLFFDPDGLQVSSAFRDPNKRFFGSSRRVEFTRPTPLSYVLGEAKEVITGALQQIGPLDNYSGFGVFRGGVGLALEDLLADGAQNLRSSAVEYVKCLPANERKDLGENELPAQDAAVIRSARSGWRELSAERRVEMAHADRPPLAFIRSYIAMVRDAIGQSPEDDADELLLSLGLAAANNDYDRFQVLFGGFREAIEQSTPVLASVPADRVFWNVLIESVADEFPYRRSTVSLLDDDAPVVDASIGGGPLLAIDDESSLVIRVPGFGWRGSSLDAILSMQLPEPTRTTGGSTRSTPRFVTSDSHKGVPVRSMERTPRVAAGGREALGRSAMTHLVPTSITPSSSGSLVELKFPTIRKGSLKGAKDLRLRLRWFERDRYDPKFVDLLGEDGKAVVHYEVQKPAVPSIVPATVSPAASPVTVDGNNRAVLVLEIKPDAKSYVEFIKQDKPLQLRFEGADVQPGIGVSDVGLRKQALVTRQSSTLVTIRGKDAKRNPTLEIPAFATILRTKGLNSLQIRIPVLVTRPGGTPIRITPIVGTKTGASVEVITTRR